MSRPRLEAFLRDHGFWQSQGARGFFNSGFVLVPPSPVLANSLLQLPEPNLRAPLPPLSQVSLTLLAVLPRRNHLRRHLSRNPDPPRHLLPPPRLLRPRALRPPPHRRCLRPSLLLLPPRALQSDLRHRRGDRSRRLADPRSAGVSLRRDFRPAEEEVERGRVGVGEGLVGGGGGGDGDGVVGVEAVQA